MLDTLRIRYHQFLEEAREKSPQEAVKKALATYLQRDRIVVPVYNDFAKLKQAAKGGDGASLEFMLVDRDNAAAVSAMNKVTSRKLKGPHHTQAGYYAYAVLCNREIVGDIWCATPRMVRRAPVHPDLVFLGIECGEDEAYMFDMYVTPDARGKEITSFLLANALEHLKQNGYRRVYGFYEKNNLPALWTHRLFGYTEMPNRKVTRIGFYQKTETVSPS